MKPCSSDRAAAAGSDSAPAPAPGRVIDIDPRTDARWDAFAAAHADARVYHHPGWLDALVVAYGCRLRCLAYETADGLLEGVLPLAHSRGLLTGNRLLSLPHTPIAGPLASDPQVVTELLRAALALARRSGVRLEIRFPGEPPGLAPEAGRLVLTDPIYVRDLPGDVDQLRFGNSRNHARIKWAVNHARRAGVAVRASQLEHDLRRWYVLYLHAMRAHAHPPVPYRFFLTLARRLWPSGLMELLLAERAGPSGPELLAGSVFLRYGRTVIYAFNGRRPDALSMRPNDLLQWHAMREATVQGYRLYDFGEVPVAQAGLAQFKTKWGAVATAPCRFIGDPHGTREPSSDAVPMRRANWLTAAWRRLPLVATEQLGRVLYRIG